MMRLTKSAAAMAICTALAAFSLGQSKSDKNTIKGVVVWRDSLNKSVAHPIEDAIAVAYDLAKKPVSQSQPSGSDGKFTLIVPESVKFFKLLVHQKQVRYWDYNPQDPFPNEDHPHDMGEIVLNDKHELSEAEADVQAEAAWFLYKLHETSATLLLERAAKAFLLQYKTDLSATGGCPESPQQFQVSYRDSGEWLGGSGSLGDDRIDGKIIMNVRSTLESMRAVVTKQEQFFKSHGFYANLDHMNAPLETFEPPGYCIELLSGFLDGKSFNTLAPAPHPNYFVLLAMPNVPGKTGDVYMYTDPTGTIRYSEWKQGVKTNLHDALPVKPDFPLGMYR
jgi:hypothetical protein